MELTLYLTTFGLKRPETNTFAPTALALVDITLMRKKSPVERGFSVKEPCLHRETFENKSPKEKGVLYKEEPKEEPG